MCPPRHNLEVYKDAKPEVKNLELKMSNELPGIVKVNLAKNLLDGHRFEKSYKKMV